LALTESALASAMAARAELAKAAAACRRAAGAFGPVASWAISTCTTPALVRLATAVPRSELRARTFS
jgi:hypothetical protein